MRNAPPRLAEADIRNELRKYIANLNAAEPDVAVINELGICGGRARADVAVINGELHGYEIKSDRDSLRRLNVQADHYGLVFDRATLVTSVRHVSTALTVLPSWWGVLRIEQWDSSVRLQSVRRSQLNPRRDARSLVELLWLEDAISLLERRNAARGVRGRPRRLVWDRICVHFELDEIAEAVRHQLKTKRAK